MRYGVFSDVHSNSEALQAVLEYYEDTSIDKYLSVGDLVGYAADPQECIAKIMPLATVTVAGNHDWAAVGLFSLEHFNAEAAKAIIWTKKRLSSQEKKFLGSLELTFDNEDLTLVHSTLKDPATFSYLTNSESARSTFDLLNKQICFVGHTHLAGIFIQSQDGEIEYFEGPMLKLKTENKYIVNVGSVGQPRDGNPAASCCIYDSLKKTVWLKRIDYDFKSSARKIAACGLPLFLAERLSIGR